MSCNDTTDTTCTRVQIDFTVIAPLKSNVLAISAVDTRLRTTTTYINEGVEFTGESLLLSREHKITNKVSNQKRQEILVLTQDDRRYPIYTDQYNNTWTHNEYRTWTRLTLDEFKRTDDKSWVVMNRTHSDFEDYVKQEQARALDVFNSSAIQNDLGESFTFTVTERLDRFSDSNLFEKLDIETRRALETLNGMN